MGDTCAPAGMRLGRHLPPVRLEYRRWSKEENVIVNTLSLTPSGETHFIDEAVVDAECARQTSPFRGSGTVNTKFATGLVDARIEQLGGSRS